VIIDIEVFTAIRQFIEEHTREAESAPEGA
jgi:hypothetical protein